MGTYLPVSISDGRIPVLNCNTKERPRRDIHLKKYVSCSNRRFFYCYFAFGYIIINKSVFNFRNVTPCFVSIYIYILLTYLSSLSQCGT